MVFIVGKIVTAVLAILTCVSARSKSYFENYPCYEQDCSRHRPYCRVVVDPECRATWRTCTARAVCYSDAEQPVLNSCTQGLPIEYSNQQAIRCTEDSQCPMNTRCEDPPSISYAEGEKPTGPRGTCCWDATKEPPNWRP